ncbi:tol-pal system YbgF family protein [Helicobacter sp. MIT 99-5507]|uniref:tetratricopeptide repeat protein n=1 Tax=Helicobacter sp. MIT 99-5507 TaxID=152489 RepID=UPI000E1E4E4B|nr:hypothetical protein [Helicobacter sp. MIT 99-5507]RDU57446.1 hypothetical protein CQA42_05855 [Helicobacter sp. MIT 99-5507]
MKKIIELEERWKSYKYRSFVFYIFIFVFIVFIALVALFVKNQYSKYSNIDNKQIASNNLASKGNTAINENNVDNSVNNDKTNTSTAINNNQSMNNYPSINFVCRKVIADKLMVRKQPSFKSQAVGYYSKNGIFCADSRAVNGLLQTNNGWISSNDNYSEVIEVNMFVDSGFNEYQDSSRVLAQNSQAPIEEINVLNDKSTQTQPTRYSSSNNTAVSNAQNNTAIQPTNAKPLINISSEKITKEREIQLKIADFKNNNNYATAIAIAEYYFDIKNYSSSLKWALNASEADSNGKAKSQSFIIYAKSLYAIGKTEEAIEVLNRYIAKTNSRDAIEALEHIRQGTI